MIESVTEVAFCISTRRRPKGLSRLLTSIDGLIVPDNYRLTVVVVDNDPFGTAASLVEQHRRPGGVSLHYVIETEPGIPAARNRSVAEATRLTDAEFIAFVDDDEYLAPDWLERMLDVHQDPSVVATVGPAIPRYDPAVPQWIVAGEFFEQRGWRRPSPDEPFPVGLARTSGILIRAEALRSMEPLFQEPTRFSGGSDRWLFQRMIDRGDRFEWVPDAHVISWVSASRARTRWLWQRQYGYAWTRSRIDLAESAASRFGLLRSGTRDVVVGAARAVASGGNRARRVRAGGRSAKGLGTIAGALGIRYQRYRVIESEAAVIGTADD